MKTLQCADQHFDVETFECTAPVWEDAPSLIPELSVEDAGIIGSAIAGAWIVAYLLRRLVKWADQQ